MVIPEDSQSTSAEQRLKDLCIELPAPPEPFGTYVEAVQTGNLLFLTGMLPTEAAPRNSSGASAPSSTSKLDAKQLTWRRSTPSRSRENIWDRSTK
jgi:hypothetical protein